MEVYFCQRDGESVKLENLIAFLRQNFNLSHLRLNLNVEFLPLRSSWYDYGETQLRETAIELVSRVRELNQSGLKDFSVNGKDYDDWKTRLETVDKLRFWLGEAFPRVK